MSAMTKMRCKNHPELRWCCKTIAITDGMYNGQRNLFFFGRFDPENPDMEKLIHNGEVVRECDCSTYDLEIIDAE